MAITWFESPRPPNHRFFKTVNVSSTPHDAMVSRWRSRVKSRPSSPSGSSSPTTSTSEIPTAPILPTPPTIVAPFTDIISPIVAPPGVRRQRSILIQPRQDIHVSRLYRTYLSRPCRALTVRKMVGPLPSHSLAVRYTLHHLDRSTLDQTLSGHTLLVTTIVDLSTPSRFVYPPPARTSRGSEAFCRWRSVPLSIMYPSMTFESSAGDSSSKSSAEPSCKRCRSLVTAVPLPIHTPGALVPTSANILPPHKRFRDSYLPKDSTEEDIDADVLADIKVDAAATKVAATIDVEAEIDASVGIGVSVGFEREDEAKDNVKSGDRGTIEVGVDVVARIDIHVGMLMLDTIKCLEQLEEGVQDMYEHMMEIPL
ncbi:hypothetical protein Tco_1184623 [Tanacetum coccineum]